MEQPITPKTIQPGRVVTTETPARKEPYVPPRVTVYGSVTELTGGGGGATFDGGATNDGLL